MTDGPSSGRRRDRFLWWLLALSVAAVVGLSAVASAFWTAGHGAPVPASADVGPAAGGTTAPPDEGSGSGAPAPSATAAPTTTVPSPARPPAPVTAPATVVNPDRPVVQQSSTEDNHDTTTTTTPTSTSTTEPGEFGNTGYATTSTLGGSVPGDR